MSQLIRDTQIDKSSLIKLARSLARTREAFLQLILELCENKTFFRISNCPEYPVKIVTSDLENKRRLFVGSIKTDRYDIALALAILYKYSTKRERKKRLGQYFTPSYVAKIAIDYLDLRKGEVLLDPGCGTGIFPVTLFRKLIEESTSPTAIGYIGIERDPLLALSAALSLDWINAPSNWKILFANYLDFQHEKMHNLLNERKKVDAIVCNPPFVRFQELGERNDLIKRLGVDPLSGLHSLFLAYSYYHFKDSRMAFIIPVEMRRTKYGTIQFEKLGRKFNLAKNELVYYEKTKHIWRHIHPEAVSMDMHAKIGHAWNITLFCPIIQKIGRPETIAKTIIKEKTTVPLGDICSIHRGISTGANHFFVISDEIVKKIGISPESNYIRKVIPTKISIKQHKVFTNKFWNSLRKKGKSCWLLTLPKKIPIADLPIGLRQYLSNGERVGLHLIPTSRSREPWYFISLPTIPDLFFTYFSRGYPEFVYNKARVYNLTNLLRLNLKLPVVPSDEKMIGLVELLNKEMIDWIDLEAVGRRYNGGLIKFEPKDLEKMPVSEYQLNNLQIGFKSLSLMSD